MLSLIHYHSPGGTLLIGTEGDKLRLCDWSISGKLRRHISACGGAIERETELSHHIAMQLDEYFSGNRRVFDAKVEAVGSDFSQQVWRALTTVAYGSTISYRELAENAGHPRAVRAVASAVADNPVSIIIPCHRIIRSDGSIGQYAGGTEAKQTLLDIESGKDVSWQ